MLSLVIIHMKTPTAIQLAEDMTFAFKSATDAYEQDPDQAVFTCDDVITLLKKHGFPDPDFNGRALQVAGVKGEARAYRERLRRMGKAIERAMKEKGITQSQMAKLTGRTVSVINRWTSGTANLEASTIFLIEEHLGIKLLNL